MRKAQRIPMNKKQTRNAVLSIRLDDTMLAAVDLLVEAGLAQSRSEAAAQFVGIGVQASEALIAKATALAEQVRALKADMLNAVKSKNLEQVEQLLAMDETLKNAKSAEGHTAVLMAAYYRASEIKELLLRQGAELDLYEAAAVGETAVLRRRIVESPEQINSHNVDGYTPLGLTAHFGHEEAGSLLLAAGADIHLRSVDGNLNNMPLHAAIAGNHPGMVRLLLAHGADPNARCEGKWRLGYTSLHVAAHFNRLDIVRLLLAAGADPELCQAEGQTAAELALAKGFAELAELFSIGRDS